MSKFFQAILSGLFFTFFIDFFFFLGLKLNYIDFYEIDLYYNIFFVDNQNLPIYLALSVLIGFLVIYTKNNAIKLSIIGVLFLLGFSTLIKDVGFKVGTYLFTKTNQTYKEGKYTYVGDVYYVGRKDITFYDKELQKIIKLDKSKAKKLQGKQ